MTVYDELQLIPLIAFVWPVTYRWQIQTPFGVSQQEMTIEASPHTGDFETTKRYGELLWFAAVAPATSQFCRLQSYTVTAWKSGQSELVFPPQSVYGRYPGLPGGRKDTACIQFHTGHRDPLTLRQFPFVGTPGAWVEDGLLTDTGMRIIEQTSQSWRMAMGVTGGLHPMFHLIAYQNVEGNTPGDVAVLGFRHVHTIRVLQHSTRAPDPTL